MAEALPQGRRLAYRLVTAAELFPRPFGQVGDGGLCWLSGCWVKDMEWIDRVLSFETWSKRNKTLCGRDGWFKLLCVSSGLILEILEHSVLLHGRVVFRCQLAPEHIGMSLKIRYPQDLFKKNQHGKWLITGPLNWIFFPSISKVSPRSTLEALWRLRRCHSGPRWKDPRLWIDDKNSDGFGF